MTVTAAVILYGDSTNLFWIADGDEKGDANAIRVVIGVLVGVFAALAMGTLFIYARKDPQKFREIASSLLLNEVAQKNAAWTHACLYFK